MLRLCSVSVCLVRACVRECGSPEGKARGQVVDTESQGGEGIDHDTMSNDGEICLWDAQKMTKPLQTVKNKEHIKVNTVSTSCFYP